jgi:hypothetical protein
VTLGCVQVVDPSTDVQPTVGIVAGHEPLTCGVSLYSMVHGAAVVQDAGAVAL